MIFFNKNILSGSLKKCSLFRNDLIFALVFHYSWYCGFDTDLIKCSLAGLCREPKHYSFHHFKLKYSDLNHSSFNQNWFIGLICVPCVLKVLYMIQFKPKLMTLLCNPVCTLWVSSDVQHRLLESVVHPQNKWISWLFLFSTKAVYFLLGLHPWQWLDGRGRNGKCTGANSG